MRLIQTLAEWRTYRDGITATKGRVGFVPTMGALHEGHRSLLERARAENDHVILSIFVNPTQFDDAKDLAGYPRQLDSDRHLAEGWADCAFVPAPGDMYPDRYHFRVAESNLSRRWEGAHRPGHFDGVLTVVLKLFQLVRPDRAYFGEKDWQQLQLIRSMTEAFFLPVEIVACPTVRDADGLALSSRNQRLDPGARRQAAGFPRLLRESPSADEAARSLRSAGFEVDYVEETGGIRHGAVRIGGVRLIDNVRL